MTITIGIHGVVKIKIGSVKTGTTSNNRCIQWRDITFTDDLGNATVVTAHANSSESDIAISM